MNTIHSRLGGEVPVWAISHQGHEVPGVREGEEEASDLKLPQLAGESDRL